MITYEFPAKEAFIPTPVKEFYEKTDTVTIPIKLSFPLGDAWGLAEGNALIDRVVTAVKKMVAELNTPNPEETQNDPESFNR